MHNKEILKRVKNINLNTYGLDKNSNFQIINIIKQKEFSIFDLKIKIIGTKPRFIRKIKVPIIGIHNIRNTTAAIAVATSVGIPNDIIKKSLINFKGVQRRFTKIFNFRNIPFYDDYAHHPTEISQVLNGVRDVYKESEIVCIFQPHRISRLKNLSKEFTECFNKADTVVLCPIFKAGENINLGFSYLTFAKRLASNSKVKLIMIQTENDLFNFVRQNIYGNKIVIGMGAGSISNWIRNLQSKLK